MSLKNLRILRESILTEVKGVVLCLDFAEDEEGETKKTVEKLGATNVSIVSIVSNVDSIMFTAKDKNHAFKIIDAIYGPEEERDSTEFYYEAGIEEAKRYNEKNK